MNTVKYWLEQLPEDISKKALANHAKQFPNSDIIEADSIADAVNKAFTWRGSKEGMNYWRTVYHNAISGKEQSAAQ